MKAEFRFEIPDKWVAAVAAGTVRRSGGMLINAETGRYVAHLQEAGSSSIANNVAPLGAMLGKAAPVVLGGAMAVGTVGAVAAIVGVGVSLAGFKMVRDRLDSIKKTLSDQDERLTRIGALQERAEVRASARDAAEVGATLAAAEEAWHRSDRTGFLQANVDGPLLRAEIYWRTLLPGMLRSSAFSLDEAFAAYGNVLQLTAVRLQVLMLEDELPAARQYAQDVARWHAETTRAITSTDLARERCPDPFSADWRSVRNTAQTALDAAREADLLLHQRVLLLQELGEQDLSPVAYVESARSRSGLLVLPLHNDASPTASADTVILPRNRQQ